MSTLISTNITQNPFARMLTTHVDGTIEEFDFAIGDLVENLRYIEDEEIKTITGKVRAFKINIKRLAKVSSIPTRYQDYTFTEDVELLSITFDCSTHNHSNLVTIDSKEIVEFEGVEDVTSVHVLYDMKVDVTQIYDDESVSTVSLTPGDQIAELVAKNSVAGKPNIEGSFRYNKFVYAKSNETNTGLIIKSLIFMNSKVVYNIPIDRIIKISGIADEAVEPSEITNAINDENSTGVNIVADVVCEDAVTINKEFYISGANYGTPANTGKRATSEIIEGESTFAGLIELGSDADVIIDGVTFTEGAKIKATDSSRLTLKNCRFVGMNPTEAKEMLIQGALGSGDGVKLEIENCYFGNVNSEATGKIYNLFELGCKLLDGSYIKNNHFAEEICKHNVINIYDVEENSTITIENNMFEYSANAIRVGIKGEPTTTININKNTYLKTDEVDKDYAGLLLIQPYGTATTSFKNCTINLNRNINRSNVPQLYYSYAGAGDMQFTEFNIPTITLNGKVVQKAKVVPDPED